MASFPMASHFNEKVAMDLKKWGDRWILHMIDMFSRFTVSVFVSQKRPTDIVEKVMKNWIGVFGMMGSIMTDNGGEFNSEEMRELGSVLNVVLCMTAGYSPLQNGLCERNHAVVDSMLLKLKDHRGTPDDILLCWANMAKNSLQMVHGYSSYQLVFGHNPELPNIMTEKPPALQGVTSSEVLAKHLNVLHGAFIMSESYERIRRALRGKIRAAEQTFEHGDKVYYKRDGHER